MLLRVIDFETTGIPTESDRHAIVEVGWTDLVDLPKHLETDRAQWAITAPRSILVNPGRPIPVEAMAVHHIRDVDVVDAPRSDNVLLRLMRDVDVFVAHNAAFDRQFFPGGDKPWICTFRCARHVWPDAPAHGNQVLRYFLDLGVDSSFAAPPHRAGPDTHVTAHILRSLIGHYSVDELIKLTSEPVLLRHVRVGKYRGQPWSDMDVGYLEWVLRQDFDPDVKHTARHYLKGGIREAS